MRNRFLRRLLGRRGHTDAVVPADRARLMVLTDDPWPDFCGYRAWCDAKRRPCDVCGGRCCACRHTERRDEGTDERR